MSGRERNAGEFRLAGELMLAGTMVVTIAGLWGCGSSATLSSSEGSGAALQGRVLGGQQPVSGASIQLYAAGSAGDGLGAASLLGAHVVTTDGSGNFAITGDYTCPAANTQVYLIASGGNPGLAGVGDNAASRMIVALGNCGDLTSATNVVINEATTAAAAWALAQFMGVGGVVGSSASNAAGLANAFAVAKNIVDSSTGLAQLSALSSGAVTEPEKLYSLANALAACVNSDGGSACGPLFTAATTANGVPTNTLDSARNVVRNPASNVEAVFNAGAAQGPFQPALSTAPSDWTMSITYGGCMQACGGLNSPGALAIDSRGNVWVANYYGAVVSEFSPSGVPVAASGIAGVGLHNSYGIAVDGLDNVWVTNDQSVTAAGNHGEGSVSEFSAAGVELSGYGYTGGGIFYPLAAAADSNGDIWVADYGGSAATLLAANGSAVSGGSGFGSSAIPFPTAVAVDGSHNGWLAVQGAAVRVSPAGVVTSFACCDDPAGLAIDAGGDVWIADYSASSVVELNAMGAVVNRTTLLGGAGGPQGIAIDGAGDVWAANYKGNSLVQLAGTTAAAISPAQGYGRDAPLNEPYGLAIDASGNVWLSNSGGDTITQFVGLASPVKTPLLGPPVQP